LAVHLDQDRRRPLDQDVAEDLELVLMPAVDVGDVAQASVATSETSSILRVRG
jgi:hypothetical protein